MITGPHYSTVNIPKIRILQLYVYMIKMNKLREKIINNHYDLKEDSNDDQAATKSSNLYSFEKFQNYVF